MKRKITVQLPEHVVQRLETAAERPGASKAAIVASALERFLDAEAETIDVLRRLEGMSQQLARLAHELRLVNEVVALHARYHLTVTPPLPQAHQRAACVLGLERFEAFAAQVGQRVHLGAPLMRETIDRLSATNPDLFARDTDNEVPLGTPSEDTPHDSSAAAITNGELGRVAGVREDASSGSFPGEAHTPYR
jgi:predicted transcriptional regulator